MPYIADTFHVNNEPKQKKILYLCGIKVQMIDDNSKKDYLVGYSFQPTEKEAIEDFKRLIGPSWEPENNMMYVTIQVPDTLIDEAYNELHS